ncbi:MAG: TetR/AcrR family transcriptional regulator [Desertimonas sp.]
MEEPRNGRERLLLASAELFAEEGTHNVSLRRINERARMRNSSAAQYHFGDREGLIRALIAQHQPQVDARRHAILDVYESEPTAGFWGLANALVQPWVPKLTSGEGGPGYLQVLSDLLNSPRTVLPYDLFVDPNDSMARWKQVLDPLLSSDVKRLHRRFTAYQLTVTDLARRARSGDGGRDDRLFVSNLVDTVSAVLAAPTSRGTKRLLDERRQVTSPRSTASKATDD